jgi:hypothetical protein
MSNNIQTEELSGPIAYDGEYKEEHTLRTFEGALVFSSERQTLKIPIGYETAPNERIEVPKKENGWHVNFHLKTKDGAGFGLSGLGMNENASEGFDRYDLPLLPRLEKFTDLFFLNRSIVNLPLTRSIVPLKENYQWEFEVNSSEEEILLSWAVENFGEGQLWLMDMQENLRIEMQKTTQINIKNGGTYKVVYAAKPMENTGFISVLLSPYPNPARTTVHIPYTLKGRSPFAIQIFDANGRLVETVVRGNKNAGTYVETYDVGKLPRGMYQIVFTSYESTVPVKKAKILIVR